MRLLAFLGLLVGVSLAGLALAGPASAHATLVSSSPEDGSRVNTEPAAVLLRFDESVALVPSTAQVISATGRRADTGAAHLARGGATVVVPLQSDLPNGTYSATWRVVSADTHIVSGSITRALGVGDQVAQTLVYVGAVLLVGALAIGWLLWRGTWRLRHVLTLIWVGWAALAVGSILQFLLQGPRAQNGSWAQFARFTGIAETLDSTYGRQLIARTSLLLVLAPFLVRISRRRAVALGGGSWVTAVSAVAALCVLISIAVTGHEAVGPSPALALPAASTRPPGRSVRSKPCGRRATARCCSSRSHSSQSCSSAPRWPNVTCGRRPPPVQ